MQTSPSSSERRPSILGANLVLLISLVLFVSVGLILQTLDLIWGTIGTEIVAILLPVLVYVLVARLPLKDSLRLHWPGWPTLVFSSVTAVGLMLLAIQWGSLVGQALGYDLPLPPEMYPREAGKAALLLAALVIAAPICEELLFRGLLQGAHERNGALKAIIVSSVFFSAFHLSLLRFIVLVPVALVLGLAAWRTRSVLASIAMHAVYNGLSGVLSLVTSIRPDLSLESPLTSPVTVAAAAVLLAAGLVGLFRNGVAKPQTQSRDPRKWFRRTWPLIPVVILMMVFITSEVVIGTMPGLLVNQRLRVTGMPAAGRFEYAIHDVQDARIGQASVSITRQGDAWRVGTVVQAGAAAALTADYDWEVSSLEIKSAHISSGQGDKQAALSATRDGDRLNLDLGSGNNTVPGDALLPGEWPWRITAIAFSELAGWQVDLVALPGTNELTLAVESGAILQVQGAEPLAVPAGNYIAWKVTLGEQTLWYDADAPHALLRYDDGELSYRLQNAN